MKKLIIFIPSIEDGGVEKNLFLISNYLSKKVKNIGLITANFEYKKRFNKRIKFLGIDFKYLRKKNRILKYAYCLLLLLCQIIKEKREITILSFQANIYAIILAKVFRVKIISRSNSSPSGWSQNFLKNIIFKIFLKKADCTIVNSLDFKKEMFNRFTVNAKCIYNPFDIDYIKRKIKSSKKNIFKTKKNTLKILSVGRLTKQKDFMTLLKAINRIKNLINLKLILIGKGSEKEKLLIFIKNNKLTNKILLVGYKKNPYKYFQETDIFVLSSKFEGLPNVLLEAQYFKKFIISSNCPTGPREILLNGKAGNLFDIGNYKKLSKQILNYNRKKNVEKILLGFNSLNRFNYNKSMKEYYKSIIKFL